MESRQSLIQRRRAVANIGAITKAMEVVAAIKMRKSQELALASRPYAFKVLELLHKLSRFASLETKFTVKRPVKKTLVVVMTSDRGLIGSFNTQVLRSLERFQDKGHYFAAVGRKAEAYLLRKNLPVAASFHGFGDFVKVSEIKPLYEFVLAGFEKGDWDRVVTLSMHFRTALQQEVLTREILPMEVENIGRTVQEIIPEEGRWAELRKEVGLPARELDYLFEPSPGELLENLIPHLLKMQLYHLVLEANASEHSARRVAMKNASDNAGDLLKELTLRYNKARQAAITNELIEIVSTKSAIEK